MKCCGEVQDEASSKNAEYQGLLFDSDIKPHKSQT